jgi:hypothetical protein
MDTFMHKKAHEISKEAAFREAMRKLWEDHIIWTRQVIVSALAGLLDLNFAVERLMQNQVDIGNAIKSFYGDAAGDKLTALLKEHISGAYGVLVAAKAGDNSKLDTANKAWYKNADDISVFLSGANQQNWPVEQMKAHMKEHLDLTEAEAVARLTGKWADDIVTFEKVHFQILGMADMLSSGIVAQFPTKF